MPSWHQLLHAMFSLASSSLEYQREARGKKTGMTHYIRLAQTGETEQTVC